MIAENPVYRDEFAHKYNYDHAMAYYTKHRKGCLRRLSNWREQGLAQKALDFVGESPIILDLPCGAGRFWPLLSEREIRTFIAADSSIDMLKVANDHCPLKLRPYLELLHTSAYNINLADNSVDTIFSMRLLHHIGEAEKRAEILGEFYRVTRKNVLISFWVEGNYKAYRRRRRNQVKDGGAPKHSRNRFVFKQKEIEQELRAPGFTIRKYFDFLSYYSMLRLYVLRK